MDKLLLTPAEAAEALGLGRTKVYELMAAGVLQSVKIGASRRVPREALAEFVARLSAGAAA
jgi:excisionase family DNA binding protein